MKNETRELLINVLCNMMQAGLIDLRMVFCAIALVNSYHRTGNIKKHSQKFEKALSFQGKPYKDLVLFRELDETNKYHKRVSLAKEEDFAYINSREKIPCYDESIMEPRYTACDIKVDAFNADEISISSNKSEFFHIPNLDLNGRQINLN